MKKFLLVILAIGVVAVLAFLSGPRPEQTITVRFDDSTIPGDLDEYLAGSEGTVSGIVPGAEKEIVWADPASKAKTPVSIVYVHGFSATKHEIRPVPDKVASALGANLYFTRLNGHGSTGEALADATLDDWATDFAQAIAIGRKLGDKVIVMGTSNGGALSTWGLAQPEFAKDVAGVVLTSPAYELTGIATWLANIPWAESILPAIAGENRSWEPHNELHGKWWTQSYPSRAIFPMTSLLQVLKSVDKSTINVPALFVYSPTDQVVHASEIELVADEWGGEVTRLKLETSGDPFDHVIAGDILSPDNTDKAADAIIEWAGSL